MANKKEFYIGIDVGKASCGVACCDSEYRIVKYNGKEC
jgi:RNase H-fold protein (predicted Holliday junction resolvase)